MSRKPLLARNRRIHALRTAQVGVQVEEPGPRPLHSEVRIKIPRVKQSIPVGSSPTLIDPGDIIRYHNALCRARGVRGWNHNQGWDRSLWRLLLQYDEGIIAEAMRRCAMYSKHWWSPKYVSRMCVEVANE